MYMKESIKELLRNSRRFISNKETAIHINTWVQIIGILIAAIWGIYIFIYKEVVIPQLAPANLILDVQLKKLGTKKSLTAIEVDASATNSGSRSIYLLPNIWVASGFNVKNQEISDISPYADSVLKSQDAYTLKHAVEKSNGRNVISIGRFFPVQRLNPNEKISRKLVFYIPTGQYDFIQNQVIVLTTTKSNGITADWKLDKDGDPIPTVYLMDHNGNGKAIFADNNGDYEAGEIELKKVEDKSTFSLW